MPVPLVGESRLPEPEPIDLYDHEIIEIQKIWDVIRDRHQKTYKNYDKVEAEITSRFADAGFVVHVNWHYWMLEGETQEGAMPVITITGRVEKHDFDHDRQVHEVTSNILGIPGQEGVIKTDKETLRNFLGDQGGHSHGHSHG